ncbi:MAG TPA: DUF3445 domain-containing protein [Acidimicrobiales bacterium]|nr:DUF3445 domain-containing protein [Acidimicrobiales bacterium]
MGTRVLRHEPWLVRDARAETELDLRRRLLVEQRPSVFACRPEAQGAALDAARLVHAWADEHGAPPDGGRKTDDHPLLGAGARVQEDLCVMVRDRGRWRLGAAVVCFPSLWVLAEKLGQPLEGIHGPVPHYAAELGPRVERFFDRFGPSHPVVRRNLSIWPALVLWAPVRSLPPELAEGATADGTPGLWLRSERQTLRRLTPSGGVLFSIRVQVAALSALQGRPDVARALGAWLDAPGSEARRAQLGAALPSLRTWLEAAGGG